jgi:hypothetical protein
MEWYNYLTAFFAGAFLANTVPHFVHGISGNKFPTPFSNPSGVGLSSSTTNMIWALFNLLVACLLFTAAKIGNDHSLSILVCFAGIAVMGIMSSIHFKSKHKE